MITFWWWLFTTYQRYHTRSLPPPLSLFLSLSHLILHVDLNELSTTWSKAEMAAAFSFVNNVNRISARYLPLYLLNFRYLHKICPRNSNLIANKRPKHRLQLVQSQNCVGKVDEYSFARVWGFSFPLSVIGLLIDKLMMRWVSLQYNSSLI